MQPYDVVILGSGAGGSTLAWRLAREGKRVLVVERGDYIPREVENWDPHEVAVLGRYGAKDTWFDAEGNGFSPYTHYCVGGNTKLYGAALLRMRTSDFDEVTHHGGKSPAWPISYADLEPYYGQAEQLYTVHGTRGVDPLDPPSSTAYPFAALEHEPRIAELHDDLVALGLHPYPLPLGLRPAIDAPAVPSRFDGYPDPSEAKADAHTSALRRALAVPTVELWTLTRAVRLITDPGGKSVVGVELERGSERVIVRAGFVVLACGAINSAALMLRSANDHHPNGLGNGSDQVGRNYMTHHNGLLIAVGAAPNPSRFGKTLGVGDFYRGSAPGELPSGSMQLMGRMDLAGLASLAEGTLSLRPEEIAARSLDVFLTAEDLPSAENRISLRGDGTIRVEYTPTNLVAYERLRVQVSAMLVAADLRHGRPEPLFLHRRLGISGVTHQCGTLRMGRNPRTSVVDPSCRVHELDNVYVADAGVFVSSSAVNPSLTIMANALRVGDRIAARL